MVLDILGGRYIHLKYLKIVHLIKLTTRWIFLIGVFFAFAVANIETMSFVLVSPSQLMALNDVCIFLFNNLLNTLEEISASVKI